MKVPLLLYPVVFLLFVGLTVGYFLSFSPRFYSRRISSLTSRLANSSEPVFVLTSSKPVNDLTRIPSFPARKKTILSAYDNQSNAQLIDFTKIYLPRVVFYQPTLSSLQFWRFLKNYYRPVNSIAPILVYQLRD
ncbi:MAG: hypothetical protein WC686_02245 [Candidatus Shapirobacteria bacterium]|jgi:hypothetical protein